MLSFIEFGDELLVNWTTDNAQLQPAIAGLTSGRFVAAWVDVSRTGGDTSGAAVRAQLFNADGGTAGPEFVAPTTVQGDQTFPIVSALSDGRYVVAWIDGDFVSNDLMVRARIFDPDGAPASNDFMLPVSAAGSQFSPAIAGLADGRFVAVWTDTATEGNAGIRAQVFAANGMRDGAEFSVNRTATGLQSDPVVTALPGGGFVVAWSDNGSGTGGDTDASSVHAQVFDSSGRRAGNDILVNGTTQNTQHRPSIATLADGRFVVTWTDDSRLTGDLAGSAVHGRIFNADGSPWGNEFRLNSTTAAN